MNRRNGSTLSPPGEVAKNMGEVMRDIVALAELQLELLKSDCREGRKRMLAAVAMLLFAGMVAIGTVPIVLIVIAEFLSQAGLSRAAAFSVALLSGCIVTFATGVAGWYCLRNVVRTLERSRVELSRNMTWIIHALKPPTPIESEHLKER